MRTIRMLDCTLRDGGCINNFEFGTSYMRKILSALEASGVEIIELGYIDEKKEVNGDGLNLLMKLAFLKIITWKKRRMCRMLL